MTATPRTVDIHAHYYPSAFIDRIAQEGGTFGGAVTFGEAGPTVAVGALRAGPLAAPFIELEPRIEEMDATGVDVQALSLSQPMVYWAGDDLGRRLAETYNDGLAEAHEAYPERFVGLMTLPMQSPRLALEELERAARLPGMRGVYLATVVGDRELADESFWPIYERIADLGLPVFLHPLNVIGGERLKSYFLANLLGNPFDTAVAAAHLIFGGVLDRWPALHVCLPHAGGALPYLIGRLHHGWSVRPECRHLERGPMEYLTRFTYDTIAHSPQALGYLVRTVGAERVMLGSDYCFDMGCARPVETVTTHPELDETQQALILGGNAARLLGLDSLAQP